MELKTSGGMTLIKDDDLHKIKRIAEYLPIVRNSIFKAAFHVKKLDGLLQELIGANIISNSA